MNEVVSVKWVRVISRGRYAHKKGVLIGPERFWHKEEVATLKYLLEAYPTIQIEEKIRQNDNVVALNLENYNKNNYRPPVSMEGPDEDSDDGDEDPAAQVPDNTNNADADGAVTVDNPEPDNNNPGDVVVDGAVVGNGDVTTGEQTPDPVDDASGEPDNKSDGDEDPAVQMPDNTNNADADGAVTVDNPEQPSAEKEVIPQQAKETEKVAANTQQQNQTNNKPNNGGGKKNKGKNKNASTEVTPKEA